MPDRIDTKAALAGSLPPNPANYKSDFRCMTAAIARLEKVRAALIQEVAGQEAAEETLRLTHQEIAVDDELLAERDRLLDVIPECAAHGNRCIPHAIEWVLASINLEKTAKNCPVPDEDGDMDAGAMMNFCERVAALAVKQPKPPTPKPIAPEPQALIRDWADRFDAKEETEIDVGPLRDSALSVSKVRVTFANKDAALAPNGKRP